MGTPLAFMRFMTNRMELAQKLSELDVIVRRHTPTTGFSVCPRTRVPRPSAATRRPRSPCVSPRPFRHHQYCETAPPSTRSNIAVRHRHKTLSRASPIRSVCHAFRRKRRFHMERRISAREDLRLRSVNGLSQNAIACTAEFRGRASGTQARPRGSIASSGRTSRGCPRKRPKRCRSQQGRCRDSPCRPFWGPRPW